MPTMAIENEFGASKLRQMIFETSFHDRDFCITLRYRALSHDRLHNMISKTLIKVGHSKSGIYFSGDEALQNGRCSTVKRHNYGPESTRYPVIDQIGVSTKSHAVTGSFSVAPPELSDCFMWCRMRLSDGIATYFQHLMNRFQSGALRLELWRFY